MKLLHINCSPKKKKSNTYKLAKTFLEGYLKEKPLQIEEVFLYDLNIEFCTGCLYCMRSGKPCPLEDDTALLVEKIENSDILLWNIPHLGPGGVPSKLKVLLERICNTGALFYKEDSPIKDNNILIMGCGHPLQEDVKDLEEIEKIFKKNFGVLSFLIIPEADLLTFYPDDYHTKRLLKRVKKTGALFAKDRDISKFQELLKDPIIESKIYIDKYLKPLKIN